MLLSFSLQVIVAPAIAGVAVGVGVPILLAYIYGVVPVSLCQNGVCGVSASPLGVRIDFDDDDDLGADAGTSASAAAAAALSSPAPGLTSGFVFLDPSAASESADDAASANDPVGPSVYFAAAGEPGKRATDAVSLDASNNLGLVGNPSIGERALLLLAHFFSSYRSLARPELPAQVERPGEKLNGPAQSAGCVREGARADGQLSTAPRSASLHARLSTFSTFVSRALDSCHFAVIKENA